MNRRFIAGAHPGVQYQYRYTTTIKEYRIEKNRADEKAPVRSGLERWIKTIR
jgi:hypothetical protein